MRSKIAAICVFMAGSNVAPCQNTFIVNLDDYQGGYAAGGRSVRAVSDGYLVFGDQVSADVLGTTHLVVYKIDLSGSFVWRKELNPGSDYDYNFGVYDPIANLDTGGFACVVDKFNGPDELLQLYWLNTEGDTVRTHRCQLPAITESYGGYFGSRYTRATLDGGYIYAGFKSAYGDGSDTVPAQNSALLCKLDPSGDTLWTKTYAQLPATLVAYCVNEYWGGGFVLSGIHHDGTGNNPSFLIRTDENGDELWRRFYGGRPIAGGDQAAVRVLEDGSVVTYCSYRDNSWSMQYDQFMLTKWDADGNIAWQKKSHYGYYSFNGDFEVLPDGSFITCGETYGYANLSKFNSTGDSLWSRNYFVTHSEHYAYDVEPTSDGGFIATGEAEQGAQDPHPGEEVIWVLKTDSFGCVVPGCQNVGVQEYALNLQDLLHVSPNPASDQFSFSLALPEGTSVQGQMRAQLLDATGKLVLQQAVQQNLNVLSARMNVSALPAGTYYLHLRDAKRWLAGGKVVVQ